MSFLSSIKERFFQRKLAEERSLRQRKEESLRPVNLKGAKRITLLFPASDAEERKAIDRWRDAQKRDGRKVRLLGYFPQDIGQATFNFPAITTKETNWYGLPVGSLVEEFRKESCDLLLRLGPPEHDLLDYLAVIKNASLKVGPHTTLSKSPYHLQFDAATLIHFKDQLAAIEQIFSYTNATATT